jgi:cell division GTPase FtsZ
VCVGLGGGTGSGSALAMVTAAREHLTKHGHKARIGAIVSLPSLSEGRQVAANAVNAFGELVLAGVSPLIVIDNDKIDKIYKPSMRQLLPKANEIASSLLHLLNTLSAVRSPYVSFDRAELEQLLDGGIMVVGSSDIPVDQLKSPVDVSEAVREQLLDGVLADVDLSTGKVAACLFVAATEVLDQFSSEYFNAGFTYFESVMGGENVVVHRGIYDESAEGLQCYSAVSGLAPPKDKLAALTKLAGSALSGSTASHLKVD